MPLVRAVAHATTDRHGIEISEQIEDDRAPIRRDVERDPRPLIRIEVDTATGDELEVGFTGAGETARRVLLCGERSGAEADDQGGEGESMKHGGAGLRVPN